jgi:hypothetical protein
MSQLLSHCRHQAFATHRLKPMRQTTFHRSKRRPDSTVTHKGQSCEVVGIGAA